MDLKFAWWNCGLSPPSTKAKKKEPNLGFVISIITLLESREVDVLGICEVNEQDIDLIANIIESLENTELKLVNLYKKQGNSIEDFCLVYNAKKLSITSYGESLNAWDTVTDKKLKAGVSANFVLNNEIPISLILCHWQSRKSYPHESPQRIKLGATLRSNIDEILSANVNSLIVVLGDFNDEPFDKPIQDHLSASRDAAFVIRKPRSLFNPFWSCLGTMDEVQHHPRSSGSCYYQDDGNMTHWKTFDQILFSSAFLKPNWEFVDKGAEIVNDIPIQDVDLAWSEISDHYPVLSHIRRIA